MKIASKIGLSFFSVTVACTVIAVSFLYFNAKRELLRTAKASLKSVARSRTAHIETYLEMLKISVGQLSKSVVLENVLRRTDKDFIQHNKDFEQAMTRLRRTKEVNPSIFEFLLLDKTGKVVASSDERSIGADKSTDPFFLNGQKEIFIKDVYYHESMKEPLIAVSAPLSDNQTGDLLGIIVARVKLNNLWGITTDRTGMGKTGEIIIVNKSKLMITPSRFFDNTYLKQKADTEGVRHAFLHQSAGLVPNIFTDYRGTRVMAAHGYIPQMQWVIIAKIDAVEAFAPLVELRWLLSLILSVLILAALLLSRSSARLIAGPIKKLYKGAEIIGSGNLDYKVGTNATDEVGQLARAFDIMTANLKATTTSIANLNNEIAERKLTEEKLRERTAELFEREEDLTITLRSIGDAMIATDTEGRVTRMNPTAENLTGWSLAEADGKPLENIFRIVNAQTHSPVSNPIAKVLASGKIAGLANHTALIARDGTVRQIADSAAPIRDMEGHIRGVVLVFQDVTTGYQMKEVLQKQATELESFFNVSLDLLCIADLEGNFIKINKAWEDTLGYPVAELEKRKFLDFVHPEDMQATLAAMSKLGEGERVLNFTNRYKHKDGSYRFIEWRSNPYGNLIYAAARDITERKRVEDELRKLSQAVEQSPAIVVITDTSSNIEYVNPKFTQVTGYALTEVLGKNPRILKSGELSAEAYKDLWVTITSGREWHGEFHNKRKDGTLYWESALITPVMDANRLIKHFLAVKEDITERKQAEETLRQSKNDLEQAYRQLKASFELESKLTVQAQAASTAKSEFVANISHEIRTPLNGVIGICELLLETKMTEEQLEYTRIINSSAKALLNIINATLDFAKIEAGKMELENIDFNLNDIVENIISILSVNAAKKKLELASVIDSNVPVSLNGDPGRLRQILINLIGNAIKFTHAGKITVNVALVEENEGKLVLRFSVHDTGIGIPDEKTDLLFKAFSQVDTSMARKFGGTGLGLTISKGLVEQMGGSIGVESVHGQGSTFWFIIPFLKQHACTKPADSLHYAAKVSEEQPEYMVQKQEQDHPEKRLRILVAEDNMANQTVILGILKKMGHTAVAVANGQEAVKALETIPYDLVLMDIQMPEMDGFEASAIIRNISSRVLDHNIPILALTAHTMSEEWAKCLAAGMNGYITKPVSTKSVAGAIANFSFSIGSVPAPSYDDIPRKHHHKGLRRLRPDDGKLADAESPYGDRSTGSSVVFDSKAFAHRLSDDSALMRKVADVFLEEMPKSISALENTVRNQQKDEAARLAHTIKGSSANIGGNQFRAVVVKIEKACHATDWREAEVLLPRLNKQYEFLERAIRNFIKAR